VFLDYFFFVLFLALFLWLVGCLVALCRALLWAWRSLMARRLKGPDDLDPDQYGA
jgi:hypothetical protein